MNLDELCICGDTYEVHFGGACTRIGRSGTPCDCKQFVSCEYAVELYQAADAMLSALADYMLDCGLDVLAERLRRKASVSTERKADVIAALGKAGDNLADVMRKATGR